MLPNTETVINWEKCMVKFEGHPKSILEKGKGYRLHTAQFIDTRCYRGQKSFQLSKHPFFSAILGWHGAQVLAVPLGKPFDIEHS